MVREDCRSGRSLRRRAARRDCRVKIAELQRTPVILVPAATGPAPLGLSSTGDSRMNTAWTALGTPAISIPMPVSNGLPLGLQLTADRGQDARDSNGDPPRAAARRPPQ
jgi:Asp-tRNA(Asn)/Glu-tRNA(Gln) amidotransferase A subunit family amidase